MLYLILKLLLNHHFNLDAVENDNKMILYSTTRGVPGTHDVINEFNKNQHNLIKNFIFFLKMEGILIK